MSNIIIKNELPTYELKLPSSGKEIRVRPFIVKEEKLLLMAAESKDEDEIVKTTKQIVQNCILDDVDVDKLPFFDVDFLIIALRAKSLGDKVEVHFTCQNLVEPQGIVCNKVFPVAVDISEAVVDYKKKVEPGIELGGKNPISVKMRYPTYSIMKFLEENDNPIERKIKIIVECIDMIVQGDKVTTHKDYSKDELRAFVEGLTQEQFDKLADFVDNFPGFVVRLDAKCTGCGFDHHIEYREFQSFFL